MTQLYVYLDNRIFKLESKYFECSTVAPVSMITSNYSECPLDCQEKSLWGECPAKCKPFEGDPNCCAATCPAKCTNR